MSVRIAIIFLTGLCSVAVAAAQQGNNVQATISKNRILIGEQLQLTIEVQAAPGTDLRFPTDSLPHFELQGAPKVDTLGENKYRAMYTITSFDSGHWVIPSFALAAGLRTDTIPVDVTFSDFNPDQPYHDITDVEEVPAAEKKTSWWLFIAGGILAVLLFYFVFRKGKPAAKPTPPAVSSVNAYEEAIRQLKALEESNVPVREYYTSLTGIFRLYIYRTKGILSLQKTTDDLVVQLRSLQLDQEPFDELSQALRMSDFVKFAKYIPVKEDTVRSLDAIRRAVIRIEEDERNRTTLTKNTHA